MAEVYYPKLLTNTEAFPANIMFTFYERSSTTSSSAEDIVHLYMPEHFGQPNTVSWDSQFGGGQALLAAGAGAATLAADAMSWASRRFGSGAGAARIAGFSGAMTGAIQKYGRAASDIGRIGELKAGVMLNPYLTQMFRGVDLRNFEYTFRLTPFSESDCDDILKIIKIFRKWALPSGPEGGGASIYLNYPGEVEVQYQWAGGENIFLHRFKRSVITELNIDYTGTGMWTMLRNGFPTETLLSVRLGEIEIVVREDVEDGY
jgi:hypothetical protein